MIQNFRSARPIVVAMAMITIGTTLMVAAFASADQNMDKKTLENLQAAYNGESNANAKYMAYARKAEQDGYYKVAVLFRAAAGAEEIHLKNHAQVIKSMGAIPEAQIKLPEIKSTKENLQDAVNGENYENKSMYPEFISQAEKADNAKAVQTFAYARYAEGYHAKLYQEALDNLDNWKNTDAKFYFCPTCGYLVAGKPDFKLCPICATPENDFLITT